jgi:hypothetical protein
VPFIVEAYLAESDRLLWRARERDEGKAYDLALRADSDPRLEIRVARVEDADGTASAPSGEEAVVVLSEPDTPLVSRSQSLDPASRERAKRESNLR